jgi:hypothetical protein
MPSVVPYHRNSDNESDSGSEEQPEMTGFIAYPSDASIDELEAEDFPTYFHEVERRLYHSSPTCPYPLPVDAPEQEVSSNTIPISVLSNQVLVLLMQTISAAERFQCSCPSTDWRLLHWPCARCPGATPRPSGSGARPLYRDWEMVGRYNGSRRSRLVIRSLADEAIYLG